MCPFVHWCRCRSLITFVVICRFKNNKNSTVIKLGTCYVNVWRHLWVKYYIVQVFIVQYNFSIELKNRPFPNMWFYEYFSYFWREELTLNLSQYVRYILYYNLWWVVLKCTQNTLDFGPNSFLITLHWNIRKQKPIKPKRNEGKHWI